MTDTQKPPLQIKTFAQYIELALRTKSPGRMAPVVVDGQIQFNEKGKPVTYCADSSLYANYEHGHTGIMSEVGEALGDLKSNRFYGNLFPEANFVGELGDIWWFYAICVYVYMEAEKLVFAEDNRTDPDSLLVHGDSEIYFERTGDVNNITLSPVNQKFLLEDLQQLGLLASLQDMEATEVALTPFDPKDEGAASALVAELEQMGEFLQQFGTELRCLTHNYVYALTGHTEWKFALEHVWVFNIEKLRLRFPDKFSSDNAIGRESLAAEAAVLQQAV